MAKIQKFLIVILVAWFFFPSHADARNKIFNIRHWAAPDHVRVVIDASDDIPYTVDKTGKKLLIDFQNTETPEDLPSEILLAKPGIDKIVVIPLPTGAVRVGLTIADNVRTKVFHIARIPEKPYRVVVDIELPDVAKQAGREREQVKVLRKDKIIVIDPGHGGEDPGAVGKLGTKEKRVVLEISKKLKDVINKKKGYRAFLTRNGDYYVPFKKRMKIAREYGAELFVSIHADACRRRSARGSSVYCLSLRGASSEAARILARNENLADIIGGSPNGESSDQLDPIILNMFQTNTMNSSKIFGATVLRHLHKVNYVKFKGVQEAPFIVLKLPEIPSILVETAYISNPKEEKMLRSRRFQNAIAKALANSITEFLPLAPSRPSTAPKVVIAKSEEERALPDNEKQPPDEIVQQTGKLQTREMQPHTAYETDTPKEKNALYSVRKGDTAETIASMHNTTVSNLLALNEIKRDETLAEGRVLKVPITQRDVAKDKDVHTPADRADIASSKPEFRPAEKIKKADDKEISPPVRVKSASAVPPSALVLYKVKKGDSLDKIAKKHKTTLSALLKLNTIKPRDPLYVGRLVRVPVREMEAAEVLKDTDTKRVNVVEESSSAKRVHDEVVVYKVKKGDSLDKIAKKHHTTIGALLQQNKIKLREPLYVGRLVRVPLRGKAVTEAPKSTDTKRVHVSEESSSPKDVHDEVVVYKVRKGDSLDKIAKKHHTTIGALLQQNKIKLREPLYVGRLVRVPLREKAVTEVPKSTDTKKRVHVSEESSSPQDVRDEVVVYKVKKGDSLDRIAKENNTTISTLLKLNNMKMRETLYVGRKLKVPDTGTAKERGKKPFIKKSAKTYVYKVKKGDTLDKIARRFNVSIADVRRINKIKNHDVLYVNQKLKLPSNPTL